MDSGSTESASYSGCTIMHENLVKSARNSRKTSNGNAAENSGDNLGILRSESILQNWLYTEKAIIEKISQICEASISGVQRWILREHHCNQMEALLAPDSLSQQLVTMLPTALLSVGLLDGIALSSSMDSLSSCLLQHDSRVARLTPRDFHPSSSTSVMSGLLQKMIHQLCGVKSESADMDVLSCWMAEEGSRVKCLVLVVEGVESCESPDFSFFIQLLCDWRHELPLSLVLCLSSPPSCLRHILPSATASRLKTCCFSFPPQQALIEELFQTAFMEADSVLLPGHTCVQILSRLANFHSNSFSLLLSSLKVLYLQHSAHQALLPLAAGLRHTQSRSSLVQFVRGLPSTLVHSSTLLLHSDPQADRGRSTGSEPPAGSMQPKSGAEQSQAPGPAKPASSARVLRSGRSSRGGSARKPQTPKAASGSIGHHDKVPSGSAAPAEAAVVLDMGSAREVESLADALMELKTSMEEWKAAVKCVQSAVSGLNLLPPAPASLLNTLLQVLPSEELPGAQEGSLSTPASALSTAFSSAIRNATPEDLLRLLQTWMTLCHPFLPHLMSSMEEAMSSLPGGEEHSKPGPASAPAASSGTEAGAGRPGTRRAAQKAQMGMSADKRRRKLLSDAEAGTRPAASSGGQEQMTALFQKLLRRASRVIQPSEPSAPLHPLFALLPDPGLIQCLVPPLRTALAHTLLQGNAGGSRPPGWAHCCQRRLAPSEQQTAVEQPLPAACLGYRSALIGRVATGADVHINMADWQASFLQHSSGALAQPPPARRGRKSEKQGVQAEAEAEDGTEAEKEREFGVATAELQLLGVIQPVKRRSAVVRLAALL